MAKEVDREEDETEDKEVLGPKPSREVSGQETEVDLTEDDDDEAEGQQETKKERRNKRYSELEERVRAAEERSQRFEQELSAARQRADMEAAARARPAEGKDEYEEKIKQLSDQRLSKLALIRRTVSDPDATQALARESLELEGQIADLRSERAARKFAATQPRQGGDTISQILHAEFPQFTSNPKLMNYAYGEYMRLTARGEPEGLETARKANRTALTDMGLAPRQVTAPTAAQQMRHGGQPSSQGPAPASSKVKLTGSLRKLARAREALLNPNGDDSEADKKFAKRLRKADIL
jgi:hypothetical protein